MAYIRKRFLLTDTDMFRDGKTNYKIVLSSSPTKEEIFAKKELQYFFKQISDIELTTVEDDLVEFNVYSYYFSIGKNKLYDKLLKDDTFLIENDNDVYGDSVRLFGKGNMIFFNGNGNGPILSVYEFLKINFNYQFFAKDEYFIDKRIYAKVPVLDIEFYPDIPKRSLGYPDTCDDELTIYRTRLCNTLYTDWIEFCHTYFKILPKEIYYENHKDWYSPDGKNLCLSNSEMKAEFIKRVEEIIKHKNGKFFMLGQEDTFDFCSCDKCRKKIKEYGTASGLVMEFTNDVVDKVTKWMDKECPDKHIKFVTFSYNMTHDAPVVYNDAHGKYEPINKKVIAKPNIAVMLVPYNVVYSTDYLDSKNYEAKRQLLGWQAVCNDIMIWSYCTNFQNYMLPFNNTKSIKQNYTILHDIGTSFLYDQGPHDSHVPTFEELKIYLQSNLMWDNSYDTDKLIKEFTDAYYKEASSYMRYVLNLQKERWYFIEETYQKYMYSYDSFNELMDKKYWSEEYIESLEEIFNLAYKAIENTSNYDLLKKRIDKEYLSVRFIKLYLYPEIFKDIELERKKFQEDKERLNIKFLHEGGDGLLQWKK